MALDFGHEEFLIFGDFLFKLNVDSSFFLLGIRLISEKSDGSFLKGDFPVEGIFHVEERIIFVKILLIVKGLIVQVKTNIFLVLETSLFIGEIAMNIFVILSFFKKFSFFA